MPTSKLTELIARYQELGIDSQIDYQKFYLYSIITHSTAIEGSTVTEIENQLLFDKGITAKGRTLEEQMMNLDLKKAYERSIELAKSHDVISVNMLKELSSLVMKNTGSTYQTVLGSFSTANGDLRLLNVTAGIGGRSYMGFTKVPSRLEDFCNKLYAARHSLNKTNLDEIYDLSFEAHYGLVTIHPWADGNGRMARLLMNQIQFEYGVIPSKVLKEDKEGYIKSLAQAQESENSRIFKSFMYENLCKNLQKEIADIEQTIRDDLKVKQLIARQLTDIKHKYGKPRRSQIIHVDEIEEILLTSATEMESGLNADSMFISVHTRSGEMRFSRAAARTARE